MRLDEGTAHMPNKITICLSASQWKLLLREESVFADHVMFRLIAVIVKQGKGYEIVLDEDQLEALLDHICELSNHESNAKTQKQLDTLYDYLKNFYDKFDEDDTDYSEHSSNTGAVSLLKVLALALPEEIWRTIAIRQGQTLHDLHRIIVEAFDRQDEDFYSFYFSPIRFRTLDPRKIFQQADEYIDPCVWRDEDMIGSDVKDASTAPIGDLNLKKGQEFYYLFGSSDDRWHRITVEQTGEEADDGTYPRIVERKGESPEQYPDPDEEEID